MKTELLASKLHFPPRRQDFVRRPELLESLQAGLGGKLTLVSAPAGFGKTTVVSEWLRECGHAAAWLSLDKHDNDPARFLTYLIAALQRIDAQIGVDVQAVLEESPAPHFETLLTRLLREMERLPEKTILVLDDYHMIDARPVQELLSFLVEYLPPTTHLVIAGRSDPALPIAKLRVRGEVNEVRTAHLRFMHREVAAFLNDRMGLELSAEAIAALQARTEGWIASLKLAAISMQGRHDWPEFIARFSGSNRFVIDYLVDEVMTRQPERVQAFLRRTSILERFCAPLGEYVAGESEAQEIIDYLDRANLFLIPLDDHREWYRYHHLFADFLGQRLLVSEREAIPELHRRASQWFENQGLVEEAIQHAMSGGDLEGAVRLVDRIAADLVVRRESNTLIRFIEQLPSELCQDFPMLCVWHAWALLFMGQHEKVEPALSVAEAYQQKAPGALNPGYVTTVRAYLEGDFLKSIDLAERALNDMDQAAPGRTTLIFQGAAVLQSGVNHLELGRLDKAEQLLEAAARLNQEAGNDYAALASFEQLAKLALIRGQLQQALVLYRRGLELAKNWQDRRGKPQGSLIAAAGSHLGLGMALYHLNDLAGAAIHIQRGVDLLELGGLKGRNQSYTMLAYLKQAQGDFQAAVELFRKACAIEDTLLARRINLSSLTRLTQLGLLLSRGGTEAQRLLAEASQRMEKHGLHANDEADFSGPAGYPGELNYSDLACCLIAQERAAEALPLLTRLLGAATAMERHFDELRYRVLIALAQQALGNPQAALDSLGQALTLAEPQGYVRLFVDEGQPMAELLRLAVSKNIAPGYASQLLAAFPGDAQNAIPIGKEQAAGQEILVEPLSEREIEVLRLMAEGLKYQEIAERLVISINTVRHHNRNIFGKLNVNNRTQAIGKAQEMNLL